MFLRGGDVSRLFILFFKKITPYPIADNIYYYIFPVFQFSLFSVRQVGTTRVQLSYFFLEARRHAQVGMANIVWYQLANSQFQNVFPNSFTQAFAVGFKSCFAPTRTGKNLGYFSFKISCFTIVLNTSDFIIVSREQTEVDPCFLP